MYHFFVNSSQISEKTISIIGPDVNHIKNVLRMKLEEQILISNGEDKGYLCKLVSIDDEEVTADIIGMGGNGAELPAKIYLFQGLPKSDKMELIVQKAVELGVYEIIPVATKRAIVKLDEKKEANKIKRWSLIAESAAKQSGRMMIPEVKNVMTLKEAIDYGKDFDYNLIPYELFQGMYETKEIVKKIEAKNSIGIFIGPEGGFDETEIEYAKEKGIHPISLGKRILRTETAGLTILSILMFQLEN
ncbi:MAG: 16S rRNA (uracil(1498)-N(3))-methyltransferase [Clostridiales bacterium]|nr:16S rRNA (uracil(1498)-N(3))-methyltransferase [Clostridiales bacterium]